MRLRWSTGALNFETEGTPPDVGTRVYLRDVDGNLQVFTVVRVDRSISVAPVSLDVIRSELTETDPDTRFSQALDIAAEMHDGVPKMSPKADRVDVWMDRAEIHLQAERGGAWG